MSGLVGYGSSDEEDSPGHVLTPTTHENTQHTADTVYPNGSAKALKPIPIHAQPSSEIGAMVGPVAPPQDATSREDNVAAPSSPYTAQRSAIRDLTLPSHPNFDIPPSPPGSPNPGAEEKFAHFLDLKTQGVHFNAKLASSAALKNPSLLTKLIQFSGVEGSQQYQTVLPLEFWNPQGFPDWAYKEALGKSQQDVSKRKQVEGAKLKRESIDFVNAGESASTANDAANGPGAGTKPVRESAAERVMAGLNRGKTGSPSSKSGPRLPNR